MLERLVCECDGPDCDRHLDGDTFMLEIEMNDCVRRAYECECGAVTVTLSRDRLDRI